MPKNRLLADDNRGPAVDHYRRAEIDTDEWSDPVSWPASASWRPQRRTSRATDSFFESYVRWRQACEDARAAYDRWRATEPPGRRLAFAAYHAALDGEEHAARIHSQWTDRLRAER